MVASAVDDTNGTAAITPPATGGPYTSYQLTVCEKANSSACLTVPDCAAANIGSCPIPGCSPFTTYTVVAVGTAAGIPDSAPSAAAEFTTRISCVAGRRAQAVGACLLAQLRAIGASARN